MPLILDHITAYLVLTTIQLFKARWARTWPKATARITAVHDAMTWGGPARDITFAYTWDGKPHTGTLRKVFVFESSAKQYSAGFSLGTDIVIRQPSCFDLLLLGSNRPCMQPRILLVDHMQGAEYSNS